MKKKPILALIAVVALSMTACGGKTEEAANTNVSEPVVESSVESQNVAEPTEAPVQEAQEKVSDEAPASEEVPASKEAPVAEAKPYTMSELVFPNGVTPENIDVYEFYNWGYRDPSVVQPYYTVTNTSDSAYCIELDPDQANYKYTDYNFEPGESITFPAFLYQGRADLYGEQKLGYWLNNDDSSELLHEGRVKISEAKPERNRVQKMTTITFDASKVYCDMTLLDVAVELPINGTSLQSNTTDYVIFYDEAGNVISSSSDLVWLNFHNEEGTNIFSNYTEEEIANMNITCDFTYPVSYVVTGEPFTWAKAEIYYSYELPKE